MLNTTNSLSLFEGRLIRLTPFDHEHDPVIVSTWTFEPRIRPLLGGAISPLAPAAVRKRFEKIESQMEQKGQLFHFALRLRQDNRLVGMARIFWIDFHTGKGVLDLAVGDSSDRRQGYGSDALRLLLRFAFDELNLHRLTAWTDVENLPGLGLLRQAGFVEEALQREAAFRDGKYMDVIIMGLLRSEWQRQP